MIIVRNSQLNQDTVEALNLLLDLNLPTKTAFKLVRMIKEISSLIDDKIKLERKIFDRYVEKDSAGNPIMAIDQNGNPIPNAYKLSDSEAFHSEISELNSIESELPFEKLNSDEFQLDSIKVRDLMKLEFIFEI